MKLLKRLLVFAFCIGLQASLISISYAADNDLNGDNKSDLIFRNDTTGQISGWLMNGTAASSAAGLVGPGAWTVTHATDFNGDGKADLLFRNDDGSVTIWLMNGTTAIGSVGLLGPNPDWRVSHVGDFNGDGRADILWRNNSGAVTIWLMNGTTVLSQVGLLGADANWSVSHVADFDGDGKSDLLWRNTGGNVTMWLMNGATVVSAPGLLGADLLWRVSHVADFNGDGKADVLWRNNDGSVTTWLMNGGSVISAGAVLGADPNWRVSHVGDLNGDGKADLVWRNTNGAVNAWLMNGITTIAAGPVLGADANWRVSHLADYNGDGKTDLLWRNNDGSITMWLMNGLSSIGQSGILGPGAWRIVPIDMMPTIPKPDTGPSGASSKVFYIHADHLGTPRAITRSTDNVKVWEWENTEAFGNSLPNENPSALGAFKYNLRMPGQYFDLETGTFYNYFRDYDPSTGRYIQSDPIGLLGGFAMYGYVSGRPLSLFDIFGLCEVAVWQGGYIAGWKPCYDPQPSRPAPRPPQSQPAWPGRINLPTSIPADNICYPEKTPSDDFRPRDYACFAACMGAGTASTALFDAGVEVAAETGVMTAEAIEHRAARSGTNAGRLVAGAARTGATVVTRGIPLVTVYGFQNGVRQAYSVCDIACRK